MNFLSKRRRDFIFGDKMESALENFLAKNFFLKFFQVTWESTKCMLKSPNEDRFFLFLHM